ncbi:MAG: ABC transporter permease, partial [Acidobacteria bacterium]|nr:ABC transporter permease [Acidobacteriota bacterium]
LLYAERRRTFASFRLVGAKPRQLLFAALIEAALLALVASLLGAPLGLLVGRGIEAVLAALGSPIPVAGSLVSWPALGWAVLIGVVATVAAAVVPALRVCRVPPIEAVDDAASGPRPSTTGTLRTAAIAALLAGGAVTVVLLQGRSTAVALTAGAVAAAVVFLVGLTPMALAAIVSGGVRILPVPPAALRRIASRDVRRSRTRTAATTGALAIATAVIVGLAVCLTSFVASLEAEVERTVQADLVVDSGTFTRGGLPADLLVELKDTPGVDAATGWQLARGTLGSTPIRATGLDADAALEVVGFDFVGPAPTRLQSDSILLSEQAATAAGVTVGESVPVVFTSGGTEFLDVAGIFRGGGALIGDGVVDRSVVLRQVPATPDLAALVALDPDDPAAADAVAALAAKYGIEGVLQPEEFVDQRSDLLRGFQRVIQWMLLFTLLQALVGVVNTLLLSVGERRREFGLLRATGATRPQVHRMILLEGVALAVVGALVGLVLGLVLSRVALLPLAPLGLDVFVVPVPAVAAVALLAVVVGVLAAVLPARWASRVPPLVAVSDTGDLELRRRRRRRTTVPTTVVPVPVPAVVPVPIPVPVAASVPPPIPVPVAASVPMAFGGLAPVDLYVPPGVDPSTLTPVVTIGAGAHAGDGGA